MEIKLSTNNHNILTSGIVFTHERSSDIKIEVKADNGFSFTVVLKFSENDTIEVVETYKRLNMQAAAQEIFDVAKKLTNHAQQQLKAWPYKF